ncbi:Homocysteine S-methyltransferase YbgG [Spathaspora sp. JA1]|nr:Homocysteine S-methyltransferase YbgG [Spathaspora sp. JA1]
MKDIRQIIRNRRLVMDGALGTQLESVVDKHPLWSGAAILTNPDLVEQVHREYLNSGADMIVTATYQLSQSILRRHTELNDRQIEGIWETAIDIAVRAIDNRDNVFVIGSIGPYSASLGSGAEYRNVEAVSNEFLQQYHTPLFQYLSNNDKVDVIGMETVSTLQEFTVFHEMKHIKPYYISITSNNCVTLIDGTPISHVVSYVKEKSDEWFIGLGINCTEYTLISEIIKNINLPLILYPNLGYVAEGEKVKPKEKDDKEWVRNVSDWLRNENVRVIGGCCGTTPLEIKQISDVINVRI